MYEGSKAAVRTPHEMTKMTDVIFVIPCGAFTAGVHQGSASNPFLFVLTLDGMDRVRNVDVRAVVKTAPIQLKMREQHLRWQAPGKRPRGAPKERWKDVIKRDLAEVGATVDDALDKMRWLADQLRLRKFRNGDFCLEGQPGSGNRVAVNWERLLEVVQKDPQRCACELSEELERNLSTMAQHLRDLG
ncbi:unnamed protein product [Heligmosomoides polygyrus]|uniref:NADAR domain-containing protein n=1 Tax=Heligmosomoides polygyrus TaxID=6339 RepID=A0A183GLA8_HELPZ|nr:unnamed protein product [Heligmosomoides polygyrus]